MALTTYPIHDNVKDDDRSKNRGRECHQAQGTAKCVGRSCNPCKKESSPMIWKCQNKQGPTSANVNFKDLPWTSRPANASRHKQTMSTADEDAFFSKLKTLHTEYSRVLTENTQLKAQLHDVQRDNTDLKSELKETRALLGEAIVNASKQVCCVVLPKKNHSELGTSQKMRFLDRLNLKG